MMPEAEYASGVPVKTTRFNLKSLNDLVEPLENLVIKESIAGSQHSLLILFDPFPNDKF